jgi:hypothetical protein
VTPLEPLVWMPEGKSLSSNQLTGMTCQNRPWKLSQGVILRGYCCELTLLHRWDDVRLVLLGCQTSRGEGVPSLQAFGAEGESLFDDVEEQRHLVSGFSELDGVVN